MLSQTPSNTWKTCIGTRILDSKGQPWSCRKLPGDTLWVSSDRTLAKLERPLKLFWATFHFTESRGPERGSDTPRVTQHIYGNNSCQLISNRCKPIALMGGQWGRGNGGECQRFSGIHQASMLLFRERFCEDEVVFSSFPGSSFLLHLHTLRGVVER